MSSSDSGRSISSSLPISELIKHIKHSFRERDFNEVQKILMDRENGMKIEMQNLEERACSLERSVDLKELERLKVDELLHKTQRKCKDLEETITGLIEEKRVSNDREERAQERCDKIAAENFKMKNENHKLIFELNDKIKELKNKNSENEGLAGVCQEKCKCFDTMAVKMGQEIEDLRHEKLAVVKTLEELRLKQLEGDRVVEELKLESLDANKIIDELRLKKSESDKVAELYKSRFENLLPKIRKEVLADVATMKVGDLVDLVNDVRKLTTSEEGGNLNFPNSKAKNDRSGNGSKPNDAEDVVILSPGVRSSGLSKKETMAPHKELSTRTKVVKITPKDFNVRLPNTHTKEKWEVLAKKKIRPSKFHCRTTTKALGIYRDLKTIMRRLGWSRFWSSAWPTYHGLTLEFLSTYVLTRDNNQSAESIQFQLNNRQYSMTMAEVSAIFHVTNRGSANLRFDRDSIWDAITRVNDQDEARRFLPHNAPASAIRNPSIRYINRVVAHSILARGESAKISTADLYLIHCISHKRHWHFASYLCLQFESQCKEGGNLLIGGMVTAFAEHLQIPLSGLEPVPGSHFVDRPTLIKMKMLKQEGATLWFHQEADPWTTAPSPALTDIAHDLFGANLSMHSQRHWEDYEVARALLGQLDEDAEDEQARGGDDDTSMHDVDQAFQDMMGHPLHHIDQPESSRAGEQCGRDPYAQLRQDFVYMQTDITALKISFEGLQANYAGLQNDMLTLVRLEQERAKREREQALREAEHHIYFQHFHGWGQQQGFWPLHPPLQSEL